MSSTAAAVCLALQSEINSSLSVLSSRVEQQQILCVTHMNVIAAEEKLSREVFAQK